jgi:exodeoxyribonuclease VII large subunit
VQGETSAAEVAAAIRGFNALEPHGAIARPDVLIVARGGGSLEDLWSFNEEIVVRAAAESAIPLVAAIGHETDWTLIDHAADMRAPTPTGAAEMVVPVRAELLANVDDLARRHGHAMLRSAERRRADLRSAARALPSPDALFAAKRQRLDLAAAKLKPGLASNARAHELAYRAACQRFERLSPATRLAGHRARLEGLGHRLVASRGALVRAEQARIARCREQVAAFSDRSRRAIGVLRERRAERIAALHTLLNSLGYKAVLARGYALVRDGDGQPVRSAAAIAAGQALAIEFADGSINATADGAKAKRKASATVRQGSLFES